MLKARLTSTLLILIGFTGSYPIPSLAKDQKLARPFCYYMTGPLSCLDSKTTKSNSEILHQYSPAGGLTVLESLSDHDLIHVPESCKEHLVSVLNLLREYDLAAWKGANQNAGRIHNEIQKKLNGLKDSKDPGQSVCFAPVVSAYGAATLTIPYAYTTSEYGPVNFDSHDIDEIYKSNLLPIFNLDRAAVFAFKLSEAGVIQGVQQSGDDLGSYNCSSSQIQFDWTQRPEDVGGVIMHEMDHFLRDKLELLPLGKEWSISDLILDETLASTLGGFRPS